MATREEYNTCMKPYMAGSKPKEQRQLDFCIGAKLCSGKAKNEEKAREMCLEPKEPKTRKPKIKCDVQQIVGCLIKNTDFRPGKVEESLTKSILICVCEEKPKTKAQSKREFLSQFGFEGK